MAGFKTHFTTSTVLGIGYGAAGHLYFDMPLPASVLAGGLFSVAGILPDVDSDHGHSLREIMAFLSAVIPMLLLERFRQLEWSHETIVLAAGGIYLFIRFGVAEFMRRYTVHRGMWHSIPAAVITGLIVYLLCSCPDIELRIYKTAAAAAGFLWHLLLDEFYSLQPRRGRLRPKKSFGTALKMFSKNPWANISTYGKLIALIALVMNEPSWLPPTSAPETDGVPYTAHDFSPEPLPAYAPVFPQ